MFRGDAPRLFGSFHALYCTTFTRLSSPPDSRFGSQTCRFYRETPGIKSLPPLA